MNKRIITGPHNFYPGPLFLNFIPAPIFSLWPCSSFILVSFRIFQWEKAALFSTLKILQQQAMITSSFFKSELVSLFYFNVFEFSEVFHNTLPVERSHNFIRGFSIYFSVKCQKIVISHSIPQFKAFQQLCNNILFCLITL